MKGNRDLFTQNKTRTDRLRDVLNRVELEFPQPPEGLSTEEFADAARRYREEQIGRLLEGLRVTDPQLKPEQLKQSADAATAWFENLKALNKDFPIRKPVLTLEDRPDAPWRAKGKLAFWNDRDRAAARPQGRRAARAAPQGAQVVAGRAGEAGVGRRDARGGRARGVPAARAGEPAVAGERRGAEAGDGAARAR